MCAIVCMLALHLMLQGDAAAPVDSGSQSPLTSDVFSSRGWGDNVWLIQDVDGDGVEDLAVPNGTHRAVQTGPRLGPGIDLHSGANGVRLGCIADIPFISASTGVARDLASVDGVAHIVVGGVLPGQDVARLGVALVKVESLATSTVVSSPGPSWMDRGADAFTSTSTVSLTDGTQYRIVLLSSEVSSGRLFSAVASNGQVSPFGEWDAYRESVWGDAVRIPDQNADGMPEIAVAVLPQDQWLTGGRQGAVLIVCGDSGATLRQILPMLDGGFFGASLDIVRVESGPDRLAVGIPGRWGPDSGGATKTFGASVAVYELASGIRVDAFAVNDIDPARPPLRIVGSSSSGPEAFGTSVRYATGGGAGILVVGDPGYSNGVAFGISVDTGALLWRIDGDDGRLGRDPMGDVNYGEEISPALRGKPEVVLINARRWGRGRIVAVDALKGKEIYEIRPPRGDD